MLLKQFLSNVMAPTRNARRAARDIVAHRVTHVNGTDEAAKIQRGKLREMAEALLN